MKAQKIFQSIKRSSYITLIFALLLAALLLASCGVDGSKQIGPLNDGSGIRSQIVVISDIHLGADIAYAEINQNRAALVDFLGQVQDSPTVAELVINGDFFDEWFVPATTDTYAGKDQADFVRRIASTNSEVFEAFNRIIQAGQIKVTYVPGNHDLGITAGNVDSVLPGINQARDDVQGLGTYYPDGHPEIAIEHGHRYNFFCAPDTLSNSKLAPGSILPPGYFYTRIATLHVVQKCTTPGDVIPEVTPNPDGGVNQELTYVYWNIWKNLLQKLPVENGFTDKIIVTNIDGFTQTYAISDIMPFQASPGGFIDMNLYKGSLDNWDERQTINHVAVHSGTLEALQTAAEASGTDDQAERQYFDNTASNVRIVVFGHTHAAKIIPGVNHAGLKTIYANSGTWIDHNPENTTMDFLVISPRQQVPDSMIKVQLFAIEDGRATELVANELQL